MPAPALKVLAFNCSLKSAGGREKSSTDILLQQLLDALAKHGAKGDIIRAVDHDIKPGVKSDEGEGDAWPVLRKRVVEADIVVIGTPIWLGQPSSVAKRVLERMDAFLSETDARGRMPSYGKVALAVVVGNEDGAHHTAAELFQALTEVGFTIPAGGVTYWVGEAMGGKEYKDFWKPPKLAGHRCWRPTPRISRACSRSRNIRGSRAAVDAPGTNHLLRRECIISRSRGYSTLNPEAFTTGAQRAISSSMKSLAFSESESGIASRPWAISTF
jgi:multimeric flavodoxin WrbA